MWFVCLSELILLLLDILKQGELFKMFKIFGAPRIRLPDTNKNAGVALHCA